MDVAAEVIIERPWREVGAYAMDPANDTRWIRGISEVRALTDPPLSVGGRVERVATFLGRRIEYVLEVVEIEPGARLSMRSVKSPFPMDVAYSFGDAGEGRTRAQIRVQGDASGFYKLAGPMLQAMVKRNITRDLHALKALMEG